MANVEVILSEKAVRFVLVAIETEKRRLEAVAKTSDDEDRVAEAGNDLGVYVAIEEELKRALGGG